MFERYAINGPAISGAHKVNSLVENRTAYTLQRCELSVFETYRPSFLVPLTFSDFVVTNMLRGKKVMHLLNHDGFDYLPGETVIAPANTTMRIDFPEADLENPTQCTALTIEGLHIKRTLDYLNEHFPREGGRLKWELNFSDLHFENNAEIVSLVQRLIQLCTAKGGGKDVLADLTLKELMFRIIQVQQLRDTEANLTFSENRYSLGFVVAYIKSNITAPLSIELLSQKACMSTSTFYRSFKREFGVSPVEFIIRERMQRARKLLVNPAIKIGAVAAESGFADPNYFIRLFKKITGTTPAQYRTMHQSVMH